jgi:uncharacterized protein YjiS (DUF1127 family)
MFMKSEVSTPAASAGRVAPIEYASGARRAIGAIVEGLLLWHDRAAERHALRNLDDLALKDMGLSRADVEREARKPFWLV